MKEKKLPTKEICPFCGDATGKSIFYDTITIAFTIKEPIEVLICEKAECYQLLENIVIKQEYLPEKDRVVLESEQ